jgi:hypothetical protein
MVRQEPSNQLTLGVHCPSHTFEVVRRPQLHETLTPGVWFLNERVQHSWLRVDFTVRCTRCLTDEVRHMPALCFRCLSPMEDRRDEIGKYLRIADINAVAEVWTCTNPHCGFTYMYARYG